MSSQWGLENIMLLLVSKMVRRGAGGMAYTDSWVLGA